MIKSQVKVLLREKIFDFKIFILECVSKHSKSIPRKRIDQKFLSSPFFHHFWHKNHVFDDFLVKKFFLKIFFVRSFNVSEEKNSEPSTISLPQTNLPQLYFSEFLAQNTRFLMIFGLKNSKKKFLQKIFIGSS